MSLSLSLYTCRIGSGFINFELLGKSNLEFGQIWSTVGLGSRLEQDCSSCREFEPEYHEAEDPPLSCVGTFCLWSSAITAFSVFTEIVLSPTGKEEKADDAKMLFRGQEYKALAVWRDDARNEWD
jgi:hypothetical protein